MRRIFVVRQGRKPQPCWRMFASKLRSFALRNMCKARISNAVSRQKDKQISSRDSWDINIMEADETGRLQIERGIRFADAISEWAPLSQVPKPARSWTPGNFAHCDVRPKGAALWKPASFWKSSTKTFILTSPDAKWWISDSLRFFFKFLLNFPVRCVIMKL